MKLIFEHEFFLIERPKLESLKFVCSPNQMEEIINFSLVKRILYIIFMLLNKV
jgi:hypothetical protein